MTHSFSTIINLTQHQATADQVEAGVANLSGEDLAKLKSILTFVGVSTREEREARAQEVVALATAVWQELGEPSGKAVMVGGKPSFMAPLEAALLAVGFAVGYAHSDRVSVDTILPDGSVGKSSVFKHLGFEWA